MRTSVLSKLFFTLFILGATPSCGGEAEPDAPSGVSPDESSPDTSPSAEISALYSWWGSLSQSARNAAILDRGYRDIGRYVGTECKGWVQRVVAEASRGAATVPYTYPNAYGWSWYWNSSAIGISTNIRYVQPGWIVQMNRWLPGGGITPHTAIVVGRSAYGVYWIESNFSASNTVSLRFERFEDFERATYIYGVYRYTVYYIGGW